MSGHALLDAGIDVAYQPIVQLNSGSVIAYEALARPRDPRVSDPLEYFAALDKEGLRLAGESMALRAAIEEVHGRVPRTKLFVNASPSTLVDPDFDVLELVELAEKNGLGPDDLVVEVTEAEAIVDLETLVRRTQELRRLGIGLAVDDAGAGHSSFRVITRLRPSFIKLDRELVTSVDVDGARHAFIEAMVRFSRQIGSRLVAEGIETEGELISLAGLGVDAGQGFYLARPTIGRLVLPSPDARRVIAFAAQRLRLGAAQVAVGELVGPATEVDAGCRIVEAYRRFQADPSLGLLVVTESAANRDRVVGQLTRRALECALAAPGAWAQLADCTVRDLADRLPLTIMAALDVVEVAGIIGARHPQEIADDVVVTGPRGEVVGVVAVREVVRTLAEVRHHGDLDVHPLSGLRGRAWIEGELARRLDADEATTMVVVDVDGFRRINDLGGFAAGDDVIRALGRSLGAVAAGVEDTALAHVGADDFMLVIPLRRYEEVVGDLVRRVESEVVPLVRTVLGLHPAARESERLALSIAAVDLAGAPPPGHHYLDWAQNLLSPLMQTVKGHQGHACMHRSGESTALSTWTVTSDVWRKFAFGLAEPPVVLRALDLITVSCTEPEAEGTESSISRFPGGAKEMRRLLTRYTAPLRARAESALAQGSPVMEVVIEGDEVEVLGLLDRIALVTQRIAVAQRLSVPPALALLDRLQRQRARTLTRQDRFSHAGV